MTPDEQQDQIEDLLAYLLAERGFDFTGYKRPSLRRRIEKRMHEVGAESFHDYRAFLDEHPEEFPVLFDTILIKVTAFFRDPDAWAHVADHVLPELIANRPPDAPLRVWSAGCATGEEAYTLAILLAEALGEVAFQERVKIYATDIDEEALAKARSGTFSARHLQDLDPSYRERYFDAVGGSYVFRPDLRRTLIFGRHDLASDAPISRLALLSSRNTLMYFNAELQAKVIARFHYALEDDGVLVLGKAETLLAHQGLFRPVEPRQRIFSKVPTGPSRRFDLASGLVDGAVPNDPESLLISKAAAVAPVAQLVVDVDGQMTAANASARAQFGLGPQDLGRPFQDLEVSYRPIELRSIIEAAYVTGAAQVRQGAGRELDSGRHQYFDVVVAPLIDDLGAPLGVSISFVDATETVSLRREVDRSREELQTTNEELQSANEELETTNEELQSTNEELETTNEELQSTNEELETTNEELQSANQELATMNGELQSQTLILDRSRGLLDSIVGNLPGGVVVVDSHLDVEVWNRTMADLFGLPADDAVARSFTALDIGLPVAELVTPIREALAGGRNDVELCAVDRKGGALRCRIAVSPLVIDGREIHGAVLLLTSEPDP